MEVLEELDDLAVGAGDRDFVVVQRLGEAVADHGDVGAAGEGAALRRRARAVVRVEADLVGERLGRARDARRRRDDDGVRARGRVRRRAGDARVARGHDGAGQAADGDADARGAPEVRAPNVDDGPEAARRVLYDGRDLGRRRRRALVRHGPGKRFGGHAHVVHLQEVAVVERRRLHRQDVPRVEEPAVVAVEAPLDGPRHGLRGAVARAVRREADRRVFYLTTGHVQCLGHTVRRAGVGVEVVPDDAVLAPGEGPARAV